MKPEAWKNYQSDLEKRIKKLADNDLYLEIIFLFSGLLEKELKDLIEIYEKLIPKEFVDQDKIQFSPKNFIDKDNLSLGKLKQYFSVYFSNKAVLKEIEIFNKLRIRVIHKIFDENIKNLEKEIKNYLPRFYRLMYQLSELEIYLIKKEGELRRIKILAKELGRTKSN